MKRAAGILLSVIFIGICVDWMQSYHVPLWKRFGIIMLVSLATSLLRAFIWSTPR